MCSIHRYNPVHCVLFLMGKQPSGLKKDVGEGKRRHSQRKLSKADKCYWKNTFFPLMLLWLYQIATEWNKTVCAAHVHERVELLSECMYVCSYAESHKRAQLIHRNKYSHLFTTMNKNSFYRQLTNISQLTKYNACNGSGHTEKHSMVKVHKRCAHSQNNDMCSATNEIEGNSVLKAHGIHIKTTKRENKHRNGPKEVKKTGW